MSDNIKDLVRELNDLDKDFVTVDGNLLKPSQCYHFEANPAHMLFNTNCPEALKQKIQAILAKHMPSDESNS